MERLKRELRDWTCLPAPLPQAFSLALSPRPGKHPQGKHGSPENGSRSGRAGWLSCAPTVYWGLGRVRNALGPCPKATSWAALWSGLSWLAPTTVGGDD